MEGKGGDGEHGNGADAASVPGEGAWYALTVVWAMVVSPVLSDVATPSSFVLQVSFASVY
jgi:hypothetical protein